VRRLALLVLVTVATWAVAEAPRRGYYRFPTIYRDTVVFTAEGDLWTVPTTGGVARRLTTHLGNEGPAAIAADGASIAFSASYEGPTEAYVMPLDGGLPKRLTWHGESSRVVGWTPDGKVLIATRRFSTLPSTQLAALDPTTGVATVVPLSQASDGCYDEAGTLYFTRFAFQGSHTKRYRGGTAQSLWRFDTGSAEATPLSADYPGTSKTPMLWRGRLYFLSDRDGTMNIWSMTPTGGELRQHTRHTGWEIRSAAHSAGRIVYQQGADLRIYEIERDHDAALEITLASDFDQLREKWVSAPFDYLTSAHLAPKGDRVVLTARGQLFVVPVGDGRLVEASRRSGVRYRQGRFAPDGVSLLALSDESGEVELWRLPANGVGAREQISRDGKVLRFDSLPSPDGAFIAVNDKDHEIWLYRSADKTSRRVVASQHGGLDELVWSPDSRWLAFTMPAANGLGQIWIYNVADGALFAATSERTDSTSPAWSPDGKWLYFLSDRNLQSVVGSPWGNYQPEPFYDRPTKIYALALKPGQRFPFAPADELAPDDSGKDKETDKEKDKELTTTASTKDAGKPAKDKPKVEVKIERSGLVERLFEVPLEPGRYEALSVNDTRLFVLSREVAQDAKAALLALEITGRNPKPKTLLEDVRSYELALDGKKLLVRKGETLAVVDATAGDKLDLKDKEVKLAGWRFSLDPREELRQMFTEAWRLERDYFYDRSMHKIDWPAMRARYQPLLERITDRAELSDLLAQMVSELSALHIFVRGGDIRRGKDDIAPASLGADLERDQAAGGVRVVRVFESDPDYPDELAPLARPGVDVRAGDVIELINGSSPLAVADPAVLLRNQAGKQTLLRVKSASGGISRDVVVTPISAERAADLRYAHWEHTRRVRVEELGMGEIGYLHLRAMGSGNWTEWARNFYPVFNRQGLIIDVRHNRGGNIDSWILEKLLRRAWFFWQPRVGSTYWNMQYAFRGHVTVLVDESTASDGEAFAEGFRRLGLGKVIGTRTWGGEIWLSSNNFLVDRGIATAAETGVYGPEGQWLIEGWGVEPDIVVDNLPHATFGGRDAQLEAAVAHLQELIRAKPVPPPTPPPYPDRSERAK
jgi:tricorn protease